MGHQDQAPTKLIDLLANNPYSNPVFITAVGDRLFWFDTNAQGERILWVSNGSPGDGGTFAVKTFASNIGDIFNPTAIGDKLFFWATDASSGKQNLWSSDGTPDQTQIVGDGSTGSELSLPFPTGLPSSEPGRIVPLGSNLLFSANDGKTGSELWALNPTYTGDPASDAVITLNVSAAEQRENSGQPMLFTFKRQGGDLSKPLIVKFNVSGTAGLSDYQADGASDFQLSNGTLNSLSTITFEAGSTEAKVKITPIPDQVNENDETVVLDLVLGDGYTFNTSEQRRATGKIIKPAPALITLNVSDAEQRENSGQPMLFTFKRQGGDLSQSLTVNFNVSGTAGLSDYQADGASKFQLSDGTLNSLSTITFKAGSSEATVSITPIPDQVNDNDETVDLELNLGDDYIFNTSEQRRATGKIINAAFSLREIWSPLLNSVNWGKVTRNQWVGAIPRTPADQVILLLGDGRSLVIKGSGLQVEGSGSGPYVYKGTVSGVEFRESNATRASIDLKPTLLTEIHQVLLNDLNDGAGIGEPSLNYLETRLLTGAVANPALPSISLRVASASVDEDGNETLQYIFSRDAASDQELTVKYSVGGTAIRSDYSGIQIPTSGFRKNPDPYPSVTFARNAKEATVTVSPIDDTEVEKDETVVLTLLPRAGYSVDTINPVSGLIRNDDLPKVELTATRSLVKEDGSEKLLFKFTRSVNSDTPLDVFYTLSGTANPEVDYTGAPISGDIKKIQIPATTKIINNNNNKKIFINSVNLEIDPTPDGIPENDETVILSIVAGAGYRAGGNRSATGTISAPTYSIEPSNSGFLEGETLKTLINAPSIKEQTVYWQLSGGLDAKDLSSGALSGSGVINKQGKLELNHTFRKDYKTEGNELVFIRLFSDRKRTSQLGGAAQVVVLDSSLTPVISTNVSQLSEGDTLVTTFQAQSASDRGLVYWSIKSPAEGLRALSATDLVTGELLGESRIDDNGRVSLTHVFKQDKATEGTEYATVRFYSDPERQQLIGASNPVSINDTSKAPTGYIIESDTGYNHVTEGEVFTIYVRKQNNFDKATRVQWLFNSANDDGEAGADDFFNLGQGVDEYNSLDFMPGETMKELIFPTRSDFKTENYPAQIGANYTEKARLTFYFEEIDNKGADVNLNPAYQNFDFQIHENPFYIMGGSRQNVEGENSVMRVARFGGGTNPSTVRLKAETLNNLAGHAIAGTDFVAKNVLLTFDKDGVFDISTLLKADKTSEVGGEVFAWNLYDSSGVKIDTRLATILDKPQRKLLGFIDDFLLGPISAFFSWIGGKIAQAVAPPAPSYNPTEPIAPVPGAQTEVATVATYQLRVNRSVGRIGIAAGPPQLVGNDSASFLGAALRSVGVTSDPAPLIAKVFPEYKQRLDTLYSKLVGNDSASLVGNDSASLKTHSDLKIARNEFAALTKKILLELVGNDSASLVGNDSASIIRTLVGNDSASLVGNDSASLVPAARLAIEGLTADTIVNLALTLANAPLEARFGEVFSQDKFAVSASVGAVMMSSDVPGSSISPDAFRSYKVYNLLDPSGQLIGNGGGAFSEIT